jgi:hypothetical protein
MDKSLALLDAVPADRHRLHYLALDPRQAAASAEGGAAGA